jgi:WD40 repeat protein
MAVLILLFFPAGSKMRPTLTTSFAGHGDGVIALAWDQANQQLASSCKDGSLILWDPQGRQLQRCIPSPSCLDHCAGSSCSRQEPCVHTNFTRPLEALQKSDSAAYPSLIAPCLLESWPHMLNAILASGSIWHCILIIQPPCYSVYAKPWSSFHGCTDPTDFGRLLALVAGESTMGWDFGSLQLQLVFICTLSLLTGTACNIDNNNFLK